MPGPRGARADSPRILLVDGNRIFLRTLERTLHPDQYQIRTAADVREALAELSRGGFDLVISEISFPGLSGFDLIRRLRNDLGATDIPVMLITSIADEAQVEKSRQLGVADLLLKPVRPQLVRERVRQVLEDAGRFRAAPVPAPAATAAPPEVAAISGPRPLRAISEAIRLADPRMQGVRVPVFRAATHQVLELLGDSEATVKQIARVVETDPGLSSSVLKVVNSAYYGLKKSVSTVSDACALLGLRDLGSICLGASVSEVLLKREDLVSRDCWSLSLATGFASREIGAAIGLPRNSDPGIAGILHMVGILAAVASPRLDHFAVREQVLATRCRWAEAERDLFGFDHAELGGAIVRQWGLPAWIGRVVEACEDPQKVARPDEWVVSVASLAAQRHREVAFPRNSQPAEFLAQLAEIRPRLWAMAEPKLASIAAAAWEQPDPAGVLVT